jgi:hypothetical protein
MIGHGGGIYYHSLTNPLSLTWDCPVLSSIVLSGLLCRVDSGGGLQDSSATISLNAELVG